MAGPRNVVTCEVSDKLVFFFFFRRTCFYLKQLLKESPAWQLRGIFGNSNEFRGIKAIKTSYKVENMQSYN